jgi:glycosyltransferase involved in cell wall biosynthesis
MNKTRLLIVAERSSSFYEKYLKKLLTALKDNKIEIFLLINENSQILQQIKNVTIIFSKKFSHLAKNLDEHLFLEVFNIAKEYKIEEIFFIRLFYPSRFITAYKTSNMAKEFSFSFSIFGLNEFLLKPIFKQYLNEILNLTTVKNIFLHTINPTITKEKAHKSDIINIDKISFLHDPIYESLSAYKNTSNLRKELGIHKKNFIFLYFGIYCFSKGVDILLNATKEFADIKNVTFIFAGNTKTATFDFDKRKYEKQKNIIFDDNYISEEKALKYFVTADAIVLPYRKFYEHGTSGVLVQATLANKPVIVPNISPFKETVSSDNLGLTFECESSLHLEKTLKKMIEKKMVFHNFVSYLNKITPWIKIKKKLQHKELS